MGIRRLTDEQIAWAKEQFNAGRSIRRIAEDLGCGRQTLSVALGSLGRERRMAWKFPPAYEPTPEEIAEHCARLRQAERPEDKPQAWRPPCMTRAFVSGKSVTDIEWRRDQDAEPAA